MERFERAVRFVELLLREVILAFACFIRLLKRFGIFNGRPSSAAFPTKVPTVPPTSAPMGPPIAAPIIVLSLKDAVELVSFQMIVTVGREVGVADSGR